MNVAMRIRRQALYDDSGKPVALIIPINPDSGLNEEASKGKIVDLSMFHGVIDLGDRNGLAMHEEMRSEWDRDTSR